MKRIGLVIATFCFGFFNSIAQSNAKIEASELYEKSLPAVVLAICGKSDGTTAQGTGVILRNDGVIVTNFHVCGDATTAKIKLRNGDIYDDVSLVATDERKDIAILRIKAINLPTLFVGDSDALRIGSTICAIGAPLGLEGSISSGIISSIRPASEMFSWAEGFRIIQFTAPVTHGSSGSPLLDEKGQVIGLVFAGRNEGQNLNAAIPINYITPLINSRSEGKALGKLSNQETPTRSKTTGTVEDITGVYTGGWVSNDYNVSGALVMTVSFTNGVANVRAVLTGSEFLNQIELEVTLTPMGAGIWKMDYKGKKTNIKGTGLFKGGRFVGDYKFKKLIWADRGQWILDKTS